MTAAPGVGHNSAASDKGITAGLIKSFVERIERLEEEKKNLSTDIKEVYSEVKSSGLDGKIIRLAIKRRKMDKADLQEQEAVLALYLDALGEYVSTPLGQAAVGRASAKG